MYLALLGGGVAQVEADVVGHLGGVTAAGTQTVLVSRAAHGAFDSGHGSS